MEHDTGGTGYKWHRTQLEQDTIGTEHRWNRTQVEQDTSEPGHKSAVRTQTARVGAAVFCQEDGGRYGSPVPGTFG